MKKHWLVVSSNSKFEKMQWENINEYLLKYPESKIEVFYKEQGSFDKIFCLETTQTYNQLDLDCNSHFQGSLKRANKKPNDISKYDYSFNDLFQQLFNSAS